MADQFRAAAEQLAQLQATMAMVAGAARKTGLEPAMERLQSAAARAPQTHQSAAVATPSAPTKATATATKPTRPGSQKAIWRREGRCYICGSASHKYRECKDYDPKLDNGAQGGKAANQKPLFTGRRDLKDRTAGASTETTAAGPSNEWQEVSRKKKTAARAAGKRPEPSTTTARSATQGAGGKKRSREVTGTTPPAKRVQATAPPPKAQKFSYASATSGATQLVVLTPEGNHCSKSYFEGIQGSVTKEWMDTLNKGDRPFVIDKWEYTTSFASIFTADADSTMKVVNHCTKMGVKIMTMEALQRSRRPTTILSGLLRGQAATQKRDFYERMLRYEAGTKGIEGRLEVFGDGIVTSGGNLILKIKADDIAMDRLRQIDCTIHMGPYGRVKFEPIKSKDLNKDNSAAKEALREKLKRLEEEIARGKAEMDAIEAKQRATEDGESIFTTGVTGIGLGSPSEVEAEFEDAMEEAGGEQAKSSGKTAAEGQSKKAPGGEGSSAPSYA